MSRKDIKNNILNFSKKAEEQVALVQKTPELSEDFVVSCIHRYICYKFFLDPEEAAGLSLTRMAMKSIERALEMKIPVAKPGERATTCGAAGSGAMKIALLLNALRKDFDVDIPPAKLGFARNTAEVGKLVYQAIFQKR